MDSNSKVRVQVGIHAPQRGHRAKRKPITDCVTYGKSVFHLAQPGFFLITLVRDVLGFHGLRVDAAATGRHIAVD